MLEDYQLVYIVLEVVIAFLAVAGNTLVCWSVSVNSNLQSITNFFVVSLAVADIAVGLLAIPFAITISFGFCANFYGCLFIACFVLVLTQGSIFSLLAIAVDRYIAINNPLRYNSLVTGQRAKAFITLCWVLSVIIGLTPLMGWNTGSNSSSAETNTKLPICPEGKTHCLFEGVVTMNYMIYFNFLGCVMLPLLVMLGIYIHIFLAARRQLRLMNVKVAHTPAAGEKTFSGSCRSTLHKEVHAAKSLAIIVGLFAFCWLPLHIINAVNYLCEHCEHPGVWVMNIAIILSHANSVVNPFIYAYRIREFRQTFRKILYQHILGKRDGRRHGIGGGSTDGTGPGRCSVIRSSSHASFEGSSCGTVVNSYVLDPSLDVTTSQDSHELNCKWTSELDVVSSSYIPNGHPLKTVQQPCIVGLSTQCTEGSTADVAGMKARESSVTFVNVQAFSSHQTSCSTSTVLPEVS
ncbi:adenosine A2a receptor b [Salarias fasciatus]|uniref:Adenosine receptor A2 n=1 Tax=Salarias fasciatus TaxID=181472 RepID=A0A672I8N7_SALFA|nr:adenosine receptor A2b-like [Salarias fasciatus]XP_029941094.1 adenosine receptor A2b-like [Salarias fasciatus]